MLSKNSNDGRIQWSDDNKKIIRLINASNYPYSGAYCYLVDKKIVIRDAEIYVVITKNILLFLDKFRL